MPLNIQLFAGEPGDDVLNIDLDDLFKDLEVPPASSSSDENDQAKKVQLTQVMTNRINEVRTKTEKETMDKVAKELGYENYASMKKAEEAKFVKEKGYNPEDLDKVLEPLLQKRLADDPRLKKLEALELREREAYLESQLKAINESTGQQLKITDLPKETLDLWGKGLELEQAYYATQGKTIIAKTKSQFENGTLNHLATGAGSQGSKTRKLTEDEKQMYRSIAPHLTEDDLNKKTIPVEGK